MISLNLTSAYRQLTPAEKQFVDAFVVSIEEEAAQQQERISVTIERPISADVIEASRGMLDRALVRAAIVERVNQIAVQQELTHRRILKELSSLGFSNLGDYGTFDEQGNFTLNLSKCTPEQLAAVQEYICDVNITSSGVYSKKERLKLFPKQPALDKLADYSGLTEPGNLHFRMDSAKPSEMLTLPANTSDDAALAAYQKIAYAS